MNSFLLIMLFFSDVSSSDDLALPRDLPVYDLEKGFEDKEAESLIKDKYRYKNEWKKMLDIEKKFKENSYNLDCNTSFDCQPIPVGESKCGGPSDYVVMSNLDFNLNSNKNIISEYTNGITSLKDLLKKEDEKCEQLTKPEVACEGGKCVRK